MSHVIAQQDATENFLTEVPLGVVKDIDLGTAVYDDASMWVKDPTAAHPESFDIKFLKKIQECLSKKGKNVHLLVVNQSEDIFSGRYRTPIQKLLEKVYIYIYIYIYM